MLTGKTRHKTRPATAADIHDYFGKSAPKTVRAWVLTVDGKVVGVAGYYISAGNAVVFSDIKDGIPKMTVWRAAVEFMESLNLPVICEGSEGSKSFLERLGWTQVNDDMVFRKLMREVAADD